MEITSNALEELFGRLECSEMRGLVEEGQGMFGAITCGIEYLYDLPENAIGMDLRNMESRI